MSEYTPTEREFTALAKILGYGTARVVTDSGAFQAIIRAAKAEALRKFRQEVIDDQVETYGIVLPDVDGIIDRLNEAADEIEK